MKAYLWTTCAIFGLLTLAHLWRIVAESSKLATEPWYVIITLLAAAMCFWAWRLLRRSAAA